MLSARQHDFLLLAIFVRLQHARHDEAKSMVDAAQLLGVNSPELAFAKAVVEHLSGNHRAALAAARNCEVIEPAELGADPKALRRIRMRNYIKARAILSLTGALDDEARSALDFYLRMGRRQAPAAT
jgi:hypothetical protein